MLIESAKLNLNKFALKDCTNIAYININKQYQKTFGVSFADIQVETEKLLQKKATQVQKKREKRNQARALACNMKILWKENVLDRYRIQKIELCQYKNNISLLIFAIKRKLKYYN